MSLSTLLFWTNVVPGTILLVVYLVGVFLGFA